MEQDRGHCRPACDGSHMLTDGTPHPESARNSSRSCGLACTVGSCAKVAPTLHHPCRSFGFAADITHRSGSRRWQVYCAQQGRGAWL
jgi:hypothetical protein